MFGQYDASRVWRCAHASEISRRVSSVTYAQPAIFKDAKRGQATAAARTPASESLWQYETSNLVRLGQWSMAEAVPVFLNESNSSRGHLRDWKCNKTWIAVIKLNSYMTVKSTWKKYGTYNNIFKGSTCLRRVKVYQHNRSTNYVHL